MIQVLKELLLLTAIKQPKNHGWNFIMRGIINASSN
jgi:hypothetical protein